MKALQGNSIYLRALELEDLSFLFKNENDEDFWQVSHTQQPFSKYLLKKYLENAHLDIYEVKQLRLVIALKENDTAVGMVDLYDYNPQHKRAGVGILVLKKYQQKGYATEALQLMINHAFIYLDLHQLYACIGTDNLKSIQLFENAKFKVSGVKKDWNYYKNKFHDELFLQLIHENQ